MRKRLGAIVLCLALATALHQPAQVQAQERQGTPEEALIILLIRSTLSALDQANRTGNYSVFRDLGVPDFRASNTPASLAVAFTNLRRSVDMSAITIMNPILSEQPSVDENRILRLRGYLPTEPEPTGFDLSFLQIGGGWGLYGVGIFPGQKGPPQRNGAASAGGGARQQDNRGQAPSGNNGDSQVPTPRSRPSE